MFYCIFEEEERRSYYIITCNIIIWHFYTIMKYILFIIVVMKYFFLIILKYIKFEIKEKQIRKYYNYIYILIIEKSLTEIKLRVLIYINVI